jgi:hypothetical protein
MNSVRDKQIVILFVLSDYRLIAVPAKLLYAAVAGLSITECSASHSVLPNSFAVERFP